MIDLNSSELLTGLSIDEIEALADCQLAPSAQVRLSELLERKRDVGISADETRELDTILHKTDQLMIIKARANFTLANLRAEAATP